MSRLDWTHLSNNALAVVPILVGGITIFLALGAIVIWWMRSPVHRQRCGELTLIGAFLWALLAVIPMPRLLPQWRVDMQQPAEVETTREVQASRPDLEVAAAETASLAPERELVTVDLNTIEGRDRLAEFKALLHEGLPSADEAAPASTAPVASVITLPGPHNPRALEVGGINVLSPVVDETLAAATSPPAVRIPWLLIAAVLYLSGAVLCTAWLLIGQWWLSRIHRSRLQMEPWLSQLFDRVVPYDTHRRLRLIVSDRCSRALSWGIWRPTVVLPVSLCRPENESQIETVLLHELGHVAQRDAWSNLLICLTLPVLYPHPVFWWLRIQMRLSAELLADDWAAQQTGKTEYVEELVALAKVTTGRGILLPGVTGVFSSPSQFYRRMNMLLTREEPLATRPSRAWRCLSLGLCAGTVVLATALAGIHPAIGQQESAPDVPAVVADPNEAVAQEKPAEPKATEPKAEEPKPSEPKATEEVVQPVPPPAKPAAPSELPPPTAARPQPGVGPTAPVSPVVDKANAEEKAQLLADLRRIQERLRQLGMNDQLISVAPSRLVTTARSVAKDGKNTIVYETWTIDENGRQQKLVSSTEGQPQTKPGKPAAPKIPPGVTIYEAKVVDGKAVVQGFIFDRNGVKRELKGSDISGQVVSEVVPPGKGAVPPVSPQGVTGLIVPPIPTTPPLPLALDFGFPVLPRPADPNSIQTTGRPTPHPTIDEQGRVTGQQPLDLVSLATSYADAVGALDLAKATLSDVQTLSDKRAVSTRELRTAEIGLKTAERKEKLLRRIIESALENAKQAYEFKAANYKKGYVPQSDYESAASRVKVLSEILQSASDSDAPAKEAKPEPSDANTIRN